MITTKLKDTLSELFETYGAVSKIFDISLRLEHIYKAIRNLNQLVSKIQDKTSSRRSNKVCISHWRDSRCGSKIQSSAVRAKIYNNRLLYLLACVSLALIAKIKMT